MSKQQIALRTGLGALFIGAGALQATHRDFFTALIPERLAKHGAQVQGLATVALVGLGGSFLVPKLRTVARWGAPLLLTATLPAAVEQIRKPLEDTPLADVPKGLIALRIPVQVLVIVGVWRATRR